MRWILAAAVMLGVLAAGCGPERPGNGVTLTISASALGREGDVLRTQVARFMEQNPGVHVEIQPAPDAADQRHQLYVQWLNARTPTPDVLQLDVVWTAEFAAAGWLLPLHPAASDVADFFPGTIRANRWKDTLYALPWFVDVGMLYWRTDKMGAPPRTFDELFSLAQQHGGFVWQGARYEGLVCVFLETLGGFGGQIIDENGRVVLDAPPAREALAFLKNCVDAPGVSGSRVLTFQEEQVRFAFQNGGEAFMRNWPYAYPLMQDASESAVAGKFAVVPMPSTERGTPTATLGGAQLAINASTRHPREAWALLQFLTAPEQLLEKARVAGQYPPRPSLYNEPALAASLPIPLQQARDIIQHAAPRPVTPLYTEVSELLQVQLHRALTGQISVEEAIRIASVQMQAVLDRGADAPTTSSSAFFVILALLVAGAGVVLLRRSTAAPTAIERDEARTAWAFMLPALAAIILVTVFPLGFTLWESLLRHDLRTPWQGSPFVGPGNYLALLWDGRFVDALMHSGFFALASVGLELVIGTALALALNEVFRGRTVWRALILIPWAVPTVVAGLIWRFLFDATSGTEANIFTHPTLAWIPVIIGDVWKTVPFVTLLVLAALQTIDGSLYESARIDGANAVQRFLRITLPLLKPTLLVVVLFRGLDALRVFDLIYVMTGGGPGTATEPLALYAFNTLLQNLRFGYGSAISVCIFLVSFLSALFFVRVLGADLTGRRT